MAFESPGWANSGGSATYTAEQTRRAVFSPYARTAANTPGIISGGLLSTADLQLTAPGSGLSVNVGTGECIVGGSEGGVQGGYYARNAAIVNLSISAANPSNPRIDTVCVTISDSSYTEPTGGSGNQVAAQVVTGTPTSGATLSNLNGAAALPLSSLLLGYVLVPAGASNIITADIANKATVVPLLIGSNYLRAPAATATVMTWGAVTSGTATTNITGSGDWTASAPGGTGTIQVSFNTTKNTIPTTVATLVGFQGYTIVSGATASAITLNTYNSSDALANSEVAFFTLG